MNKSLKGRREFLQEMSAIAGSTAFLSSLPWLKAFANDQLKNQSASDRIRLAVIGVGSRGRALLKNIQEIENVEVVAVCDNYDPNYKAARKVAGNHVSAFTDHRKLLEKVSSLDGVIIATPLHEHAHITLDCLQSGVHVFCEKSMARTMEHAKQMVEESQSSGRILQIGQQRLFNPIYLNALEKIRQGEIGQITQVRAFWHRNNDWRRPVPHPSLEKKINWRLYKEYSAGLLTELASHQLQVANWFIDELPHRVMGSGNICFWKDGREVHDQVALIYDYPGGAKCLYDSLISNKHYGLEEQIMGNRGTIEPEVNRYYSEYPPKAPGIQQLLYNLESEIFDVIPIGGATWLPETGQKNRGKVITSYDQNDTFLQLVGFAKAIKAGKAYPNLLREGYHATIAVLLGEKAIDQGKAIEWPEEYKMEKEI